MRPFLGIQAMFLHGLVTVPKKFPAELAWAEKCGDTRESSLNFLFFSEPKVLDMVTHCDFCRTEHAEDL